MGKASNLTAGLSLLFVAGCGGNANSSAPIIERDGVDDGSSGGGTSAIGCGGTAGSGGVGGSVEAPAPAPTGGAGGSSPPIPCITGCSVGGECFASGEVDPLNACHYCIPERNTAGWTWLEGPSCKPGGDTCVVRVLGPAGSDSSDGSSWAQGVKTLQRGISLANLKVNVEHFPVCEVWVAAGTYRPDQGPDRIANARDASFQVGLPVSLYGGFAGTETRRSDRDPVAHTTVLTGEIGNPALRTDNSFHVVIVDYTATVDGFTITRGSANSPQADSREAMGGGVLVQANNVTLSHCRFTENHAVNGGALHANATGTTLTANSFTGNSSTDTGGGAMLNGSGTRMDDCTFENNRAASAGGAVHTTGAGGFYQRNTFLGNVAPHGGAVYNADSSSEWFECNFRNNQAATTGLAVPAGGGGMEAHGWSGTLTGGQFTGNNVVFGNGGALLLEQSSPTVQEVTFASNTTTTGGGGAIAVVAGSVTRATLRQCTFTENHATDGGALHAPSGAEVSIATSTFSSNQAQQQGGAIFATSPLVLSAPRFQGNRAGLGGGAIAHLASTLQLTNGTFSANHAQRGGALLLGGSNESVRHCSFATNTAMVSGGAIHLLNATTLEFTNSVSWGNSVSGVPSGLEAAPTAVATTSHCLLESLVPGRGNLSAPPLFVDAANGNLQLQTGSPCLDAADGSTSVSTDSNGAPRVDLPGVANVGVGTPGFADLGAYERQQ